MRHNGRQSRFFKATLLLLVVLPVGCVISRLPQREFPPIQSHALPAVDNGFLDEYGDRLDAMIAEGESAFWLLDRGDLAFNARLALADLAVSTLDIQYFIWESDETGSLLAQRVIRAADRGVRVRLLLDDILLTNRDGEIAGLDHHPNIEVRVFNPWRWRNASTLTKAFEFLVRVDQLNHRMHNKAYVADNRFAIIGGRNIGNRYFGLDQEFVQHDLDIMISGPLVSDVSISFDDYWNSESVYTGDYFANGRDPKELYDNFTLHINGVVEEQSDLLQSFLVGTDVRLPIFRSPTISRWQSQFEIFLENVEFGTGELYYDSPQIFNTRPIQLRQSLDKLVSSAQQEVLISSPYFLPDQAFCDEVSWLTSQGVRVVVVTNSLASNNSSLAHTGYKWWRRPLIEAGAELYELRMDAELADHYRTAPVVPNRLGLHSKAIVVDRRHIYIGSANLDRRSLTVNTELGIIAEGEGIANGLFDLISRDMLPENSWRLTLNENNALIWTNSEGVTRLQPAKGLVQRGAEAILDFLPLKRLL